MLVRMHTLAHDRPTTNNTSQPRLSVSHRRRAFAVLGMAQVAPAYTIGGAGVSEER